MEIVNFLDEIDQDPNYEYIHRVFRDRLNPFDFYNDKEFKIRYRFAKQTVAFLINMIEENLRKVTRRSHAISPENQVCFIFQKLFYIQQKA